VGVIFTKIKILIMSNINKTRGVLYLLARLLGDVNAVQKGKVTKRVGRRIGGKITGRFLGKLFR
jgi:hypothetical protein